VRPPDKAARESVELPSPGGLDRDAVLAQLDRILASRLFQHSRRYPAFLQYAPVSKVPSRRSHRWIWAGAATLAAVAAIAAGVRLAAPKPAIDRFWRPILQGNDSVLAVTETLMAVAPPKAAEVNSAVTEAIDPKLFLSVQESSAKLASLLQRYGKIPEIELARNVTLPRLRRGPFILLGAFNNPWTRRSVASLRFYLKLDRDRLIRRILDRQNPSRKDWAAPMGAALQTDYALIVRAPDPDTATTMLVIAGLGERGSGAAVVGYVSALWLLLWEISNAAVNILVRTEKPIRRR
jgi:hypothetical protein